MSRKPSSSSSTVPRVVAVELNPAIYLDLLHKMLTVDAIEERLKVFVRAGKVSFSRFDPRAREATDRDVAASGPGQGLVLPLLPREGAHGRPGDVTEGHLPAHALEGRRPCGGGRNMSEHFSSRPLRVVSPPRAPERNISRPRGWRKPSRRAGGMRSSTSLPARAPTSEGEFFEALNYAGRDQLPVLFLVQNNGYAISVPQSVQTGSEIHTIAKGFKVRSVEVDGTQFTEMYKTLKPLVESMRAGSGPLLVEAHVVRMDSHSSSDDQAKYRTGEELEEVRRHDPIAHTSGRVLSWGLLDEADLRAMRAEIKTAVNAAADEADAGEDPNPETAALHIFSGVSPVDVEREPKPISEAPITMIDALNHALREEMELNPKIVMWGEDIADPKGASSA